MTTTADIIAAKLEEFLYILDEMNRLQPENGATFKCEACWLKI